MGVAAALPELSEWTLNQPVESALAHVQHPPKIFFPTQLSVFLLIIAP